MSVQLHERAIQSDPTVTNDIIIRSEVFPGLWLATDAVWQGNLRKMLAVLQEGIASAEHADFVNSLEQQQNR